MILNGACSARKRGREGEGGKEGRGGKEKFEREGTDRMWGRKKSDVVDSIPEKRG